jgi:hypothetical protein
LCCHSKSASRAQSEREWCAQLPPFTDQRARLRDTKAVVRASVVPEGVGRHSVSQDPGHCRLVVEESIVGPERAAVQLAEPQQLREKEKVRAQPSVGIAGIEAGVSGVVLQ